MMRGIGKEVGGRKGERLEEMLKCVLGGCLTFPHLWDEWRCSDDHP